MSHVQYWFRYVDDVLRLWTGPPDLVQNFLSFINSLCPTVKFTLEVGGHTINFLDLTISILNQQHSFKIFRKPTCTDITILNSSFHHPAHKNAAFMSMIHRLLTIPLSRQDFSNEVNTIKYLAYKNDVTLDIDDLIRKKSFSLLLDSTTTHPRSTTPLKWTRLPFLGKISFKLSRILQRSGLQPAFYSFNTSKNILSHLKDPIPQDERSGVYSIQCTDCPSIYIGQTGRQLKSRIREHIAAIRNNNPDKSNFGKHILNSGHSFDSNASVTLLHSAGKGKRLTALENVEIAKALNNPRVSVVNEVLPNPSLVQYFYPSSN